MPDDSFSTICPLLLTTPFAASLLELTVELVPLIAKVGRLIVAFRQNTVTPAASYAFERVRWTPLSRPKTPIS